jgi:hypothetical protein
VRTRSANLAANLLPVRPRQCVLLLRTSLRTNAKKFCLRDSFAHSRMREMCA